MISKTMMAFMASALMAGHGLPAQAQTVTSDARTGAAQETVHLGDLDLAARPGQATARLRLLVAAHATCDSIYPDAGNEADACRSAALVDARARLVRLTLQARINRVELAMR